MTTFKVQKLRENEKYFDKWANYYDRSLFQFWMKRFYKPALSHVTTLGSVLDVSCGTGQFLQELRKREKSALYGTDISSKMLSIARKKLEKKVDIKKADVHCLPFPDEKFEYVVSTESFHHYYNQKKALHEMKRVTKRDGKVIIVDVNFFSLLIHRLFEKFEPGCVKINSKKRMKELFKEANLKEIMQQRSFIFSILTVGKKQ